MESLYNFFNEIFENLYYSLIYEDRYLYILEGLGNTIIMALFATVIGVLLGTLIALIINANIHTGKFRFLRRICDLYVLVIRGTPVLLQLMIIYYVIFKSVNINIILVGIIAFGLNSSAYVSEIIKSGIISIDKGQFEASNVLGLNYVQTMYYVVLPQAIRNVLPALGNEFITLLKETSVAGYIGICELTKASDIIASRTYDYFFPLVIIAIIYFTMTYFLSKLINVMERKLNNVRS